MIPKQASCAAKPTLVFRARVVGGLIAFALASCALRPSGECHDKATCAPNPGGGGGGAGDAGSNGGGTPASGGTAAGGDTPANGGDAGAAVVACGAGAMCVPAVPAGWLGPVALWQDNAGVQSSPPACPAGYGEPSDAHAQLLAEAPSCSCTCAATGQRCDTTSAVSVFNDLGCTSQCLGASASACAPISGCSGSVGTMRASAPAPSGGTCTATVTPEVPPVAAWQEDARVCALTPAASGVCSGVNELCIPTPSAPFATQACVYRIVMDGQAIPACPAAYPNGPDALYTSFADTRACSACTCSGPTGGSCGGTVTLSGGNDCSTGFQYTLGTGCQSFTLNAPPSHIQGNYTVVAGSCSVASDARASGSARPNGNARTMCCL